MRLPADHPNFRELIVDADGKLTGICNDIRNPAMGSIGQLFARQVEFEFTFPDLECDSYSKNRHGGRLSLMKTDPQVISRKLTPATKKGRRIATKVTAFPSSGGGDCSYRRGTLL